MFLSDSAHRFFQMVHLPVLDRLLLLLSVLPLFCMKAFDIDNEVYYADFNWKELLKAIRNVKVSYTEISKLPAVKRDLALLLDKKVQFAEIGFIFRLPSWLTWKKRSPALRKRKSV